MIQGKSLRWRMVWNFPWGLCKHMDLAVKDEDMRNRRDRMAEAGAGRNPLLSRKEDKEWG